MKNAVYTGTRNMYKDMLVSIKSLLMQVKDVRVYLLIEDDTFPYFLPDSVTCINVSDQQYFKPGTPNMQSQFTYMAMMRAALCHVFPKMDRILAMDSDLIIQSDISELWTMDLKDNYFAAVPEKHRTHNGFVYCNMGFVMYNLDRLREGKADEIIDVLNRRKYTWVEQDVNNYLCQGYILELDGDYNANDWTIHTNNPKVIHYAGDKQWTKRPLVKFYEELPWPGMKGENHEAD